MKVMVVIGHQSPGQTSFCHAIARTVVETLRSGGHEVVFHDLYAERFDPVLTQEELDADAPTDPIARRHLDELVGADGYVIVHPNWWGQPPAILKGWIDRVIRNGQVYRFGADGSVTSTIAGRTALVLTTSNTPRDVELECYGDPLENLWKNCIFGLVGVTNFARRNFESMIMSAPAQRESWLAETKELVEKQFPSL
ncbi:MAG: NAD(P)H-dependent oxidoreductase [Pirellulales bacterium]|nr:NAD(P)H-dependent oxidoreductase [Pirellulales bacterium]